MDESDSKPSAILDKVGDVRAYAFDTVLGVLWIVFLLLLAATPERVKELIEFLGSTSASNLKVPDLAVGFITLLAGIVLPYCIATAVRPCVILLLVSQHHLDQYLRRLKKRVSDVAVPASLADLAQKRIRARLGFEGRVTRGMVLLCIHSGTPLLARQIARERDEIFFRAESIIPSALVLVTALRRATVPWLFCMLLGFIFTFIGFRFMNRELGKWNDNVYTAALLPEKPDQQPGGAVVIGAADLDVRSS